MRRFAASIFAIPIILIAIAGCQENPASPGERPDSAGDSRPTSAESSAHQCLGYFALAIDVENSEVEIVPLRSAEWHFNLTGILNNTMGVSAAMVPGESDPPNGLFVLDITLTHPFATKPQFAGFDVKGILMTPGTLVVDPLIFADADETELENADGYTRWWNPTEFPQPGMFGYTRGNLATAAPGALTATVNPYKLFADILDAEGSLALVSDEPLDSDQGRAVFTAGSSNTRRYRIRFQMDPGPQIVYGYAIDASWVAPSPNPPGEIPDDFPIEANQPEAYRVGFIPTVNTLYYDSESGVGGGVLRLQVNVHDWQGQLAGDIAGEVDTVRIFAPDLMAGGVDGVFLDETSTKARYEADLTGTAIPTRSGETKVICRVGSTDGSTYQQGPAPAPDSTLSAFHALTLDIPDPECQGDANNDFDEAIEVEIGEGAVGQVCLPDDYRDYFIFEVPAGYALSGSINLYCDAEPTTLGIYDLDEELLIEEDVSDGMASIGMDEVTLYPGIYYARIFTSNETQVGPYYLELDITLTDVTPRNPVEVTPDYLYCEPSYGWMHDNYLILYGNLTGLWVYDMTDPSNPVQVTSMLMSLNLGAAFYYPYIYYIYSPGGTGEYDVSCIDLTDIANPVVHESVIEYGYELDDIAMNSENLFVLTRDSTEDPQRAFAYDYVSDPMNPTEVNDVPWTDISMVTDSWYLFDPEGSNTHLILWKDTIIISMDVEDVTAWEFDGDYDHGFTVYDVASEGGYYYYVLSRESADMSNVAVMYHDVGATLSMEGELDWAGRFYSLIPAGDYVYATGFSGLGVLDVSDKSSPEGISVTPTVGSLGNGIIDGNYLYATILDSGMEIYDISYPPAPDKVGELPVANNPIQIAPVGDYLVVVDDDWDTYHAMKTVDISDPESAHVVASMPLSGWTPAMVYEGQLIAAVSASYDIVLIDASDPLSLSIVDTISFMDAIRGLLRRQNILYVCDETGDLYVYDVTDPSAPDYKTTVTLTSPITWLTASDGYMLGKSDADDIRILSLANPLSPAPVGTYVPSDIPHEIRANGDYLYICCETLFEIADISDPSSPSYLASILLPEAFNGWDYLDTDAQFAYLCGWRYSDAKPTICSMWPPDSPAIVYTFDPWDYRADDIQEYLGYLYIGSNAGIRIYDLY